ncbi:MAG: hypothetical protein ABSF41_04665 [Pseudolabrys sp.]
MPGADLSLRRDLPTRLHARLAAYDRYDLAVAALSTGLVAVAFVTYNSYAISNDEEVQQR